eukprot:CAMPEP_0195074152 /NCGR_PEP_ID=MMETSP0448-20130528/17322_1 /TAXON_ID=66468 /ORGANISM="Heterocapsa triquestra, Strain CCMP 448" /LENGTH=200 /DNA_ID=CAMNT_0040106363 /DNA_START=98 /DNA_END=696 /DNA_ORIENTATION=+
MVSLQGSPLAKLDPNPLWHCLARCIWRSSGFTTPLCGSSPAWQGLVVASLLPRTLLAEQHGQQACRGPPDGGDDEVELQGPGLEHEQQPKDVVQCHDPARAGQETFLGHLAARGQGRGDNGQEEGHYSKVEVLRQGDQHRPKPEDDGDHQHGDDVDLHLRARIAQRVSTVRVGTVVPQEDSQHKADRRGGRQHKQRRDAR